MTGRIPYLTVAIGKKAVGKTYTSNKIIKDMVQGDPSRNIPPRRVLILDVNDEFTDIKAISLKDVIRFAVHPIIEARRIRPKHPNGMPMGLDDLKNALITILKYYRSGLLLVEDINKYIHDNMKQDVLGTLCSNRHADLDIIIHYQGIGRIGTKVWQNMNWLRFHKINESCELHEKKFPGKEEIVRITEIMVNNEYNAGNIRFYQYVNIDDQKFPPNVNVEKFMAAVEQYLDQNYRKLIKKKLDIEGENGKKYTPASARQEEIDRIKRDYLIQKNT
jgi:hypothetical protein